MNTFGFLVGIVFLFPALLLLASGVWVLWSSRSTTRRAEALLRFPPVPGRIVADDHINTYDGTTGSPRIIQTVEFTPPGAPGPMRGTPLARDAFPGNATGLPVAVHLDPRAPRTFMAVHRAGVLNDRDLRRRGDRRLGADRAGGGRRRVGRGGRRGDRCDHRLRAGERPGDVTRPLRRRSSGSGSATRRAGWALVLAEGTVKNYVSALLRKLDQRDRTALALALHRVLHERR